jgi:hypothetical protein
LQRASEVIIHVGFACMLNDHRGHTLKAQVYQMASFAEERFLRRGCFFLSGGWIQGGTDRPICDCFVRFLREEEH